MDILSPIHQEILAKGLLTKEQFEQAINLRDQIQTQFGLSFPLYEVILSKYPSLFDSLLPIWLNLRPVDMIDESDFWISYEMEFPLMQEVRKAGVSEKRIEEVIEIRRTRELEKMGLTFSPPEILTALGEFSRERLLESASSSEKMPPPPPPQWDINLIAQKGPDGEPLCPDLGRLAVFNQLINDEELGACHNIQREFMDKHGLELKFVQLLHERHTIDCSILFSLLQSQTKIRYAIDMQKTLRRNLTPEGKEFLFRKLRDDGILSAQDIMDMRELGELIQKERGLTIPPAYLLIAKGIINDSDLKKWEIPFLKENVDLSTQKVFIGQGRSIGDIALESSLINSKQLAEVIYLEKYCQEDCHINLSIPDILLLKGYINRATLKSLLIAQDFAEMKRNAEFDLLKFNPDEEEKIIISVRAEGRLTPALMTKCLKAKQNLNNLGLTWSMAKILSAMGEVSWSVVTEATALRRKDPPYLYVPSWAKSCNVITLAIANSYITQEEYEESLGIAKKCQEYWDMNVPCELILLKKGYMDVRTINGLKIAIEKYHLCQEWQFRLKELNLSPELEKIFIERLIHSNKITPQDIEEYRKIQNALKDSGVPVSLSRIIFGKGKAEEWSISDLIQSESRAYPIPIPHNPRSVNPIFKVEAQLWETPLLKELLFGEIAVRQGFISKEDLHQSLKLQKKMREMCLYKKLGEILVDANLLQPETIEIILKEQSNKLKQAVWPPLKHITEEDIILSQKLEEKGLLNREEIKRSLYIVDKLKENRIEKSLFIILLERKLLPRNVLDNLV